MQIAPVFASMDISSSSTPGRSTSIVSSFGDSFTSNRALQRVLSESQEDWAVNLPRTDSRRLVAAGRDCGLIIISWLKCEVRARGLPVAGSASAVRCQLNLGHSKNSYVCG